MSDAHERFRTNRDGRVSDVYPALANVPQDLFGLCVVGVSGATYASGDWDIPFSIMSVSKPFVFALVLQALGADAARRRLGVNATGLPFNSLAAIERSEDGRTNPMVNSGAIATTSLAPGSTREEQWRFILEGLSRFAGRALAMNERGARLGPGDAIGAIRRSANCCELVGGSPSTPPTRSSSIRGNARST